MYKVFVGRKPFRLTNDMITLSEHVVPTFNGGITKIMRVHIKGVGVDFIPKEILNITDDYLYSTDMDFILDAAKHMQYVDFEEL